MSAALLTPLEVYLSNSFEPDCEFIDGRLVERQVGEYHHSLLQSLLATYINNLRARYGPKFRAFTEQRIQVGERRYRIPDICVPGAGHNRTSVIMEPPALTIEILSPDDSLSETVEKCRDYLDFGVGHVWIADPQARTVFTVDPLGCHAIPGRFVNFAAGATQVEVNFNSIFDEMDLAEALGV